MLNQSIYNLHQARIFNQTYKNIKSLNLIHLFGHPTMSTKKSQSKKSVSSKKSSQQVVEMSPTKTLETFWKKYSAETHPRIKVIDWFMLFLAAIIALQIFYVFVVGDDFPRNAAITGIFAPGGVMILLAEMRKSGEKKNFRKLAEFFLASLVLFVVSINFIG